MQKFLKKTLGGLSAKYYFRQFVFGLAIAIFIFMVSKPITLGASLMIIISTLLYPYSRFVYESIIGFIMGENVFFANAIIVLIAKICTMLTCWVCAVFVAPIGFIYLYFYNNKPHSQET